MVLWSKFDVTDNYTGADTGFPVGGEANPSEGGVEPPTYDFVQFSKKLHEIEKNLGRGRGRGAGGSPPWIRHCYIYLIFKFKQYKIATLAKFVY